MVDIVFWTSILFILYIAGQIFLFATFKIPSGSMEPGIIAGDNILVWKPVTGARIFNIFSALEGKPVRIRRMPGLRNIRRNDVLVFNNPYPHRADSIGMHMLQYYVKRCVALPGDTFRIDNGIYKTTGATGQYYRQTELSQMPDSLLLPQAGACFPADTAYRWTIKNFGPLYIPRQGDTVDINPANIALYRNIIEYETRKTVTARGRALCLGNEILSSYAFAKNYYFMAGDAALNSIDSRYWGLLPEDHIVGKAAFIRKSREPHSGKYRWKRFFKAVR